MDCFHGVSSNVLYPLLSLSLCNLIYPLELGQEAGWLTGWMLTVMRSIFRLDAATRDGWQLSEPGEQGQEGGLLHQGLSVTDVRLCVFVCVCVCVCVSVRMSIRAGSGH